MNELQSETISALTTSLIKAKADFKPFTKSKTVNAGKYKYSYADLDTINASVQDALHSNGLVIVQQTNVQDGQDVMITTLLHESGEYLRGVLSLPTRHDADHQERGSAITYTRRYAIGSLLNLTADEDDDAQATLPKNRNEPKVTKENVKEALKVNRGISEEQVESLISEVARGVGIEKNPAEFAKKVVTREDWNQLAELTPAEARSVIVAARRKGKESNEE